MRNYSITLVLRSSLTDGNRKKLLDTVRGYIKDAKFTKDEEVGQKQLAYSIKRETSGFYQNFLFETEEGIPSDLDKRLGSHEDILRFLVLRNLDTRSQIQEVKTVKTKKKAKN